MSAHRVAAITRRLMQQFRRDRRTLALLFVAPIVILSLLGYMIRGSSSAPAVGIANEDQGPLGAMFASALERSTLIRASGIQTSDADSKLKDGSLVAYIVFPSDFSQRAQAGTIAPEVHLEGSQPGTSAPDLDTLDYFGAAFIALLVFFLVFVITIVAFLNERSLGTLERLMATPLRRGEIVLGYMLGFTILALVQSAEVLTFSLAVLKVHNQGNVLLIFGMEALMALAAVNLGIFLSMFARTEFQAVQFIPLVVVPQFLLSGIIFPVSTEPKPLQVVSDVLPLTYAVNGLRDLMIKGADLTWPSLQLDIGVVGGFCVLLVAAGVATLRRRVA